MIGKQLKKYVKQGKAEELSEGLTNYLAACTKGKNHNSLRDQPYSKKRAKQRAFSFKASFMTTILRNYVIGNKNNKAIIKDPIEIKGKSLEELIKDKVAPYVGKSTKTLRKQFNITSKAKNINNIIARKMLGLDDSKNSFKGIDEFEKASIIPKTIQVGQNKKNKESMSLPPFKFKDLSEQNWDNEDCTLKNYLKESKFLFVVFQEDENNNVIFKGIIFHQIPINVLDNQIQQVWLDTQNKLKEGIKLNYKKGRVHNNFIKLKNQLVVHVRPHASKACYKKSPYSNELPTPANWINKPSDYDPKYMTTQSFWINNSYIKSVIKDLIG
ncbi:Sau3AI family type II restriction endonuclease [Apilactobacillus ozensis]|uniref:Sau3AI family type II restriction endonuclease n=1 Tax=Apilactobacillus ozensis TaxID=866801 RepID=UPI0006D07A52|nr:Sau3AI family type II restriction endonuclease [Apilactobacillus ozensis]